MLTFRCHQLCREKHRPSLAQVSGRPRCYFLIPIAKAQRTGLHIQRPERLTRDKMREVITSTNLTAADAPLWNTAEHHGSVVSVVTWLLTIATVFVVGARVVTRYATMNTLRADDIMAIFAMVRMLSRSLCHGRCHETSTDEAMHRRSLLLANPSQFLSHQPMGWVLTPTTSVQISEM